MNEKKSWILLTLSCVQVLLCTYALKARLSIFLPIVFLINGILISYALLKQPILKVNTKICFIKNPWKWSLLLIAMFVSYQLAKSILDKTPVSIEQADMLPIIQVMNQRFLSGDWSNIYSPIPEIWNGVQPIYLPAMWLPFTLSNIFQFDIRWVTVGGVWIAVILILWQLSSRTNSFTSIVLFILGLLLWWLHTETRNNLFRLTEEGIIIAYYTLLAFALAYRKPFFIGIAISLCLLSRYAIIAAFPAIIIHWILKKEWQLLVKTAITILFIVVITVLYFGLTPFSIMLNIPNTYVQHAARVWNENPEFFTYSPGMAQIFGKNHTLLQHYILLYGSFFLPFLFALFSTFYQSKLRFNNIELSIITLTLTIFYSLIDVPYLYLYYTLVFWYLIVTTLSLSLRPALQDF